MGHFNGGGIPLGEVAFGKCSQVGVPFIRMVLAWIWEIMGIFRGSPPITSLEHFKITKASSFPAGSVFPFILIRYPRIKIIFDSWRDLLI